MAIVRSTTHLMVYIDGVRRFSVAHIGDLAASDGLGFGGTFGGAYSGMTFYDIILSQGVAR